ncbi:S-adenosyl-L-methionine-dependent methyltransferase [Tribonema minus]|uniref:S-adenosyl-L-methionine-dependent methyltransferase n=1 Tax=Tribonema minus TaxID=303371 RepID=A0A835Z106_9STRA|nr:S-adenosyl-L-methionine-dependent methyltransferase [Tribonema minus]
MSSMEVFDRSVKMAQRDAAAVAPGAEHYDYLRENIAAILADRIEDISREFPLALDVGCHAGHLYKLIAEKAGLGGTGGIGGVRTLVQCDLSAGALLRAQAAAVTLPEEQRRRVKVSYVQAHPGICCGAVPTAFTLEADEEDLESHFDASTFDLVLSNLSLHWVNDLPSTLRQIRSILKPDGVFIGAMLGGETLTELRSCLLLAEQEREGGMSPHTSPSAHVSDCGNLLAAAGFTIPTVDQDTFQIEYPNAFALMEHIQAMGEGNAVLAPRTAVSRDTFLAAAALYQERHGTDSGSVVATFQVLYMIGWAPHASQPQPKRRGSAQHSLREVGAVSGGAGDAMPAVVRHQHKRDPQ